MHIAINGLFLQYPATGTGQYLLHLLTALAAREDGHTYAVYSDPGAYRPAGLGGRVTLHDAGSRVPSGRGRKLYTEQAGFPRFCRSQRANLAHVPHFAPPLLNVCPTVVTIHDLITLIFPEYTATAAVRAYAAMIAVAARRADGIIADSEHSKRDIVRLLGIAEERVSVVYLAADSRFRPAARHSDLAAARARYGLPERFVYYIGGLNRHKNVGALLQAFAALRGSIENPPALAIAGRAQSANPAVFPDLRALARDLGLPVTEADGEGGPPAGPGEVRFLRFVPEEDKPLLYAASELFVFPSLYEGFGLPPLEAMACGAPVICSNAASLPEIVGDGGLLVDPASVPDLTEAMRTVLADASLRAALQRSRARPGRAILVGTHRRRDGGRVRTDRGRRPAVRLKAGRP